MSKSCCTIPEEAKARPCCPLSHEQGKPVEWLTVNALSSRRVPARQAFRLCRDPNCDVVYYGEAGTILKISDLRVQPGFKTRSKKGLLCYCFQFRRCDVQAELERSARTHIIERIRSEVKAGNCACEVRNPSGKCCLGEVRTEVEKIREVSRLREKQKRDRGNAEEACELPARN